MRPTRDTTRAQGGKAGRDAVVYARVSTKDQEREGFSIPAQQRLLADYAQKNGLRVVREFTDVETAKTAGRTAFGDMLAYFKKHREPRPILLVEKTDRLYRNLRDWVTLDDLHLDIHFVKENTTISPDSRSGEKFVHGIKVLVAKNYVENLGEEASKGMTEKARSGVWPSSAPLGYQNTTGTDGKRTITPDPERAPHITRAFTRYATGQWSINQLAKTLREEGLTTRHGHTIYVATLHKLLQNPLYAGWFTWNGNRYDGTHTPLVTTSVYHRVQEMLDQRRGTRERHVKHTFAYTGLISCANCGCMLVGETKKARYTYYHCTGQRGPCNKPYTREEPLTEALAQALTTLSFPPEILDWVTTALKESHEDETAEHERQIQKATAAYQRLQTRLDRMYEDRLDGRLTTTDYDERARHYRREQDEARERLQTLQNANQDYLTTGLTVLEIATNLPHHFTQSPKLVRQELLKLLINNATWNDKGLTVAFREPWKTLQNTASQAAEGLTAFSRNWPARGDSNSRPSA